jgi:hypothetical protein
MADVTIEFVTDVTFDTVNRLKRNLAIPLTGILIYNKIHDTTIIQCDAGMSQPLMREA